MQLTVNLPQRYAKMRAHTATHLLHATLTQYFPNTKQAGSLVDSDLLRFDFYADTLLTPDQLKAIETTINQQIYDALPVELTETSFDEATKLGAKAFFEEKYGDVVRVIRVLQGDEVISAELCGGTHVHNTQEIGAFSILSQEAIALGIKRLAAVGIVLGCKVYHYHPYSLREKGSNENNNGIIRGFCPKGLSIQQYFEEYVKEVERKINSKPRKIFGYRSTSAINYNLKCTSK